MPDSSSSARSQGTGAPSAASHRLTHIARPSGGGDPNTELRQLLHRRLRASCLLLLGLIVLLLARRLVLQRLDLHGNNYDLEMLLAATLILCLPAFYLVRHAGPTIAQLRRVETFMFMSILFYQAALQYLWLRGGKSYPQLPAPLDAESSASVLWTLVRGRQLSFREHDGVLLASMSWAFPWSCYLLGYMLYIPTTLRRSLTLLAAVYVLIIGSTTVAMLTEQELARSYLEITVILCVLLIPPSFMGISAVRKIDTLERQVVEARSLGQYTLRRRLGAGGMGEVYLAHHRLLRRPCAVKLIRPGAANASSLVRFEREVQAMASLTHPNIVEIFDYGHTDDGTFYYVMEYVPGLSLDELVRRYGSLPPERVVYLLCQICDALREAHAVGLIHRDIKPGNILVCARGNRYDVVKLLDFGLVQRVGSAEALRLSLSTQPIPQFDVEPAELESDALYLNVTQGGSLLGTPAYMSPEQIIGDRALDARTDIYSLGGVAYFLLTGQPPFLTTLAVELMAAHIGEPVKPPSQYRPEVPADLEAVVMRCLEKDAAKRFPDTSSLADALRSCAGGWSMTAAKAFWRSHRASTATRVTLADGAETLAADPDAGSRSLPTMDAETLDTPEAVTLQPAPPRE